MADDNGNGNGRSSSQWQFFTTLFTIAAVAIGGMVSFFIQSASLNGQVAGMQAHNVGMDNTITLMIERQAEMRAQIAVLQSDLKEVETQFCASDIVRNLMHASDLRLFAMLWRKAYDVPIPTDNAYYPQICNRTAGNEVPHH